MYCVSVSKRELFTSDRLQWHLLLCREAVLKEDASMLEQSVWWATVHVCPHLLRAAAITAAVLSAVIVWSEIVSGANSKLSPLHLLVRSVDNEFVSQVSF